MMGGGFCTIGHSNRDLGAFVDILRQAEVKTVADVRSFPRSRSNPAFNIDTLPDALARHQIGYCQFPDLGGRRKVQQDVPDTVNALWRNRSFHNYADYALSASLNENTPLSGSIFSSWRTGNRTPIFWTKTKRPTVRRSAIFSGKSANGRT